MDINDNNDNWGDSRYSEMFWFFWLLVLIVLGMLTSCKTKYVTVPEYHTTTVTKHDTLIKRDSVYQRDSIFMWKDGDTIWKEKYTLLYKDRWKTKVVYRDSIRVDSINVPFPVERELTFWQKTWMKTGKILAIGLGLIIICSVIWLLARSRL